MSTKLLEQLASEPIQLLTACLSTPSALRSRLARMDEVVALRDAVASGNLTEETVRQFVATLMSDLKTGETFAHDPILSAIAVALEPLPTPFASEFLQDLSRLTLTEMGMSIRVARECLDHRRLKPTQSKEAVTCEASLRAAASSDSGEQIRGTVGDTNGHRKQAP